MKIEDIKKSIENEIVALNEQEQKLGVLNNGFKAFYEKDVKKLVARCEYRIGNLKNAHEYSYVANQEEIDNNTNDLNSAIASLNGEINDLETIKSNLSIEFGVDSYDKLSKELVSIIDDQLDMSNKTVRNASAIINHEYDAVKEEKEETIDVEDSLKEVKVEEENVEDIVPAEVEVDELDKLVSNLDKELEPIQEDKKELEEESAKLEEVPVTSIEPAPENMVAPVLEPEVNPDLNDFLAKGPESEELESAASVDDGFVKVTNIEEMVKNQEGPALVKAA